MKTRRQWQEDSHTTQQEGHWLVTQLGQALCSLPAYLSHKPSGVELLPLSVCADNLRIAHAA